MKTIMRLSCLTILLLGFAPGRALGAVGIPVVCLSCSTIVQQILDSITQIHELETAIEQYAEMAVQTEQQIYMARMEVERLRSLPGNLVKKYTDHYMRLANILDQTNIYGGDMSALIDIYRDAYPDFNVIYGIVHGEKPNPNLLQEKWRERTQRSDAVAQAMFKLSGEQLQRLRNDQESMREHVEYLLSQQNETEIQQASNALSSMMLNELQDIKSLSAMQAQHEADRNLNKLKQEQTDRELHERAKTVTDAQFEYNKKDRF
jgi:P-type conjugative transfer protein TrbJ